MNTLEIVQKLLQLIIDSQDTHTQKNAKISLVIDFIDSQKPRSDAAAIRAIERELLETSEKDDSDELPF